MAGRLRRLGTPQITSVGGTGLDQTAADARYVRRANNAQDFQSPAAVRQNLMVLGGTDIEAVITVADESTEVYASDGSTSPATISSGLNGLTFLCEADGALYSVVDGTLDAGVPAPEGLYFTNGSEFDSADQVWGVSSGYVRHLNRDDGGAGPAGGTYVNLRGEWPEVEGTPVDLEADGFSGSITVYLPAPTTIPVSYLAGARILFPGDSSGNGAAFVIPSPTSGPWTRIPLLADGTPVMNPLGSGVEVWWGRNRTGPGTSNAPGSVATFFVEAQPPAMALSDLEGVSLPSSEAQWLLTWDGVSAVGAIRHVPAYYSDRRVLAASSEHVGPTDPVEGLSPGSADSGESAVLLMGQEDENGWALAANGLYVGVEGQWVRLPDAQQPENQIVKVWHPVEPTTTQNVGEWLTHGDGIWTRVEGTGRIHAAALLDSFSDSVKVETVDGVAVHPGQVVFCRTSAVGAHRAGLRGLYYPLMEDPENPGSYIRNPDDPDNTIPFDYGDFVGRRIVVDNGDTWARSEWVCVRGRPDPLFVPSQAVAAPQLLASQRFVGDFGVLLIPGQFLVIGPPGSKVIITHLFIWAHSPPTGGDLTIDIQPSGGGTPIAGESILIEDGQYHPASADPFTAPSLPLAIDGGAYQMNCSGVGGGDPGGDLQVEVWGVIYDSEAAILS